MINGLNRHIDTQTLLRVALLAALTAVAAWVKIPLPFTPVPFTLQVFVVILAGMILDARNAALCMVVYLLLGAVGLPVFSGGRAGLGTVLGPTGGYLLSYPIAAYVVSVLHHSVPPVSGRIVRLVSPILGLAVIYTLGVIQLSVVQHIGFAAAVTAGALPFIPLDIVKGFLALLVADRLQAAGLVAKNN